MEYVMPKRISIGRVIGICSAVFFISVGLFFFSWSLFDRAYFWHRARYGTLMALSVDFSTTGTYTASLDYGQKIKDAFLGLDVPKKALSNKSPEELLSGLQGNFSIIDTDGKEIFSGPLIQDPNMIKTYYINNLIVLRSLFSWYDEANWQINVTITNRGRNLIGIPQRLVLMDDIVIFSSRAQGFIFNVISGGCLFIGTIIIIVIAVSRSKSKRPKNKEQIVGEVQT
jgi:hypothetical protein